MMGRLALKFVLDLFLWSFAVPLAFWLRMDRSINDYASLLIWYLTVGIPIKALLIWSFGIYKQAWQKIGIKDLYALIKAIGLGELALSALAFYLYPHRPIPRSIPLIEGGVALLLLGGVRLAARILYERRRISLSANREVKRVLIVGAGEAGTIIAREMLRHPEAGLVPVGFVDDDPSKRHQSFVGLPVVGRIDDLPDAVRRIQADEVLIAIPSASGDVVRRVVELARRSGVNHRIIPGIYEILAGKVSISQIREVDVEDLLRREPVRLELDVIAGYLKDKTILVTGAFDWV